MTRFIAMACILALTAACTGPTGGPRVKDSSPRKIPEPTTPGIHVSGHAIIGVSTVK
ncbi:MAG: hypothetical protein WA790_13945 [Sulfitobacter sp.]